MGKVLLAFAFALSFFVAVPQNASAQFKDWSGCTDKITSPTTPNKPPVEVASLRCVPVIFQNVVTAFLMFAGAVALVLIIYSGIKLVTSGGDPKETLAARKIMTSAIIGTIIIMSSFAIIYFIGYITNSKDCITDINQINTGGCK